MSISKMTKIVIVSHCSEATQLLEALQHSGMCQILNAEEAIVSKDSPELMTAAEKPRDIEELVHKLDKSTAFLKKFDATKKSIASILAPRTVIDEKIYNSITSDEKLLEVAKQCLQCETSIEKMKTESESLNSTLKDLAPWETFEASIEELSQLETTTAVMGLVPIQNFEEAAQQLTEMGVIIEKTGQTNNKYACLIICVNEDVVEVHKILRTVDFESANFENIRGTIAEAIKQNNEKLDQIDKELKKQHESASLMANNLVKLQVLYDHHANLLNREQTKAISPATEKTIIFEGWVKAKDYNKLEKIVSNFDASNLSEIEPTEGEEIPVEIENSKAVRPFEAITRMYGMPKSFELDPTVFFAPFFALFFGLCLTDAGYGLIMVAIFWYMLKKMQGDKKIIWMFLICSIVTVAAGAVTGSWFGDAIQNFAPGLDAFRTKIILFDPFKQPLIFFGLSLALGYIQIIFGILIGFIHNLKQKQYKTAVFNQLTWLIMLNSLTLFAVCKAGVLNKDAAPIFGYLAMLPAISIVLFSERKGGWGNRIGMGCYNLFSTVFYVGDVLSYVRLMALGMVTAGFGMAINVITKLIMEIPVVGFIFAAGFFVTGHLFNIAMSGLGSFVHSLRLQFVEFFPKFIEGGGKQFKPFAKNYKYVYMNKNNNN